MLLSMNTTGLNLKRYCILPGQEPQHQLAVTLSFCHNSCLAVIISKGLPVPWTTLTKEPFRPSSLARLLLFLFTFFLASGIPSSTAHTFSFPWLQLWLYMVRLAT